MGLPAKRSAAATVNEALTTKGPMNSLTVDHGAEFSGLVSFEQQYGIQAYYCHAYAPAERGSNERFNQNLRYFLKGLVLSTLVLKI
ncbi:hypothetical protein FEM49_03332 (plasmid) [Lactiplantibacillus plantarum]|nr:hypothetical protein FEM49_03332 [Lactiplantibacillus plantarum]